MRVILLCGGLFGALVAAAIVWVGVLLYRTEQLVRTAVPRLAALLCPRCGGAIGPGSASAVAASRAEEMRKLREHAGSMLLRRRVDPHWRFRCVACGAALRFDPGAPRSPLTAWDT